MTSRIEQSFVLTSKVISNCAFDKKGYEESPIENYISTTEQTSVATKEQNSAIRSIAYANFVLSGNQTICKFNNTMKKQLMAV